MSDQQLVDYNALLARMAKAEVAKERPTGSTIGTKAGVLSYQGNPVKGNRLDVIVVASTAANLYYEGAYDPNNISPPVCYAYGDDEATMVPHPSVEAPKHDNCKECPMNQWGSDPSGGRGKACKNSRHLAMIPASTAPDEVATAEVAVLKLPVMSVKGWSMYVNKLAALHNRPPLGMVTQVGTEPNQKSQFVVTFTDLKPVSNDMIKPLMDKQASAMDVLVKAYEAPTEKQPTNDKGKKF